MKKMRILFFMLLLMGGITLLYARDCTTDSDCSGNGGCVCEGKWEAGNCFHGGSECCACIADDTGG